MTSVKKAIKQGQPKCCDLCRRNGPIRPEQAEDLLRLAGAEPLVPFPGVKAKWPSRCLNLECRKPIEPTFDSIKHAGTGACVYCGDYGIKADDEALVYLMTHQRLNATKIGIAKVSSRRIALHEGTGWVLVTSVQMRGNQARFVEQQVLRLWSRLGLPYGVRPADMPHAGYTETVSLAARSLAEIEQDLSQAIDSIPK
ncbi:hypothetical protein ACWDR1_05525 [Streptosporangium sandarakinum]